MAKVEVEVEVKLKVEAEKYPLSNSTNKQQD